MITTLIFDWGGVFTVGKYTQYLLDVLSEEREIDIEDSYSVLDSLIIKMATADLSFDEFVTRVSNELNIEIGVNEMRDIYKKSIKHNNEVIEFVDGLSQFKLVMLSNNDETTVKLLREYHKKILDLFSDVYFSYELKMKKPDLEIFRYVIKNSNLNPEECVFIDDKQKNVDAAEMVGIKGIRFSSLDQLKADMKQLGIIS